MSLKDMILRMRGSRKMLLLIVYIALFLDNMLLTTVVPIIPEYLFRLWHPNISEQMLNGPCIAREIPPPNIPGQNLGRRKRDNVMDVPEIYSPDDYDRSDPVAFFNQWKGENREEDAGPGPPPEPPDQYYEVPDTPTPEYEFEDVPPTTTEVPCNTSNLRKQRHEMMTAENLWVGLMFGSKALIQLMTNPFIGPLTNKIGYTIPMFGGFVIMFFSTILFALGASYGWLWIARALQGVGSSSTSTSGMGMLAQAYPDDEERGSAMGIALGGLALGVLVGPTFGGLLYEWAGKELPFLLLAVLALADGSLQFLVLQPHVDRGEPEGTALKELAKDPYIAVAAGAITIGNLGIAMLEPSLPIWMIDTMNSKSAERGAAFLPCSISYLIGTNIFGPLAHKMGRWLCGLIGLVIIGFSLLAIPSAKSIAGLIIPNFFMGFAIGMIDASMFPQMGYLVDLRHVGVYGSIYAIADAAFCFAFALGPFFSGPIVRHLGFPAMMYIIAVVNFIYAPLMFMLRNPPAIESEKQQLVAQDQDGQASRYEKFSNTNSFDGGGGMPSIGAEYGTADYDYGY